MIPTYLSNLQLAQVFASHCSNVDSFILESTTSEHIVDSASQMISGFVSSSFGQIEDSSFQYFAIENPNGVRYALLQIDNGIIKSSSTNTKRCDCAIANDTYLCFIEFKTKAFSSKLSNIKKNYKKAIAQLTSTISLFDAYHNSLGVDFRTLKTVEAYICFKQGYPRKTSSQMNYQVSFAIANHGIPLSFVREKVL